MVVRPPDPVFQDVFKDLHGSIQQQGITSLKHDYAVRHCIVRNLDNTNMDLGSAIKKAFEATGSLHHNLHYMWLTKIRAVKWGDTKARVQLIYQRGKWGRPATTSALKTASTYSAYEFVEVYRLPYDIDDPMQTEKYLNGLPNGSWYNLANIEDPTHPPTAYRLKRPTTRLIYNTVLSFNPFSFTSQHLNRVNEGSVSFGQVTFQAGTLRFDGIDAPATQWNAGSGIGGRSKPSHDVQYQFTANSDGHYRQYVFWDDRTQPHKWGTFNQLGYQTSDFDPADFPSH